TTAADGASAVLAGDIDKDGFPDVIYASVNDDTVAWFRNDGAAATPGDRFVVEQTITTLADAPRALAVADIDKDLRLDVVVGSSGDDEVAWYQNTFVPADPDVPGDVGHLVWIQHVVTTHADFPRAISVVDLNDDGNLDIVVASSGDDTVAWYEQQRVPAATRENPTAPDTITFLEHVLSTTAKGARAVATGDL